MELKGSKTEANLWKAFAGESQARNKYDYYASKAKKEGYEQIAALFQKTALNEKEHAKLWFKALDGHRHHRRKSGGRRCRRERGVDQYVRRNGPAPPRRRAFGAGRSVRGRCQESKRPTRSVI